MNHLKLLIILVAISIITGCSPPPPPKEPKFSDFDIVKISLSGEKAQIINNSLEFDRKRNSWLVQIKPLKESKIGGIVKKFISKYEVKQGVGTVTLYEGELEKWEDI